MATSQGYSGTPLARKLGITDGTVVMPLGAPDDYREWLMPLPDHVTFTARLSARVDVVHLFACERKTLARTLTRVREGLRDDAAVWVSWPKRAAKVPTDITEDVIRAVALPMGFVDVKVCAVTEVWSGLKLVVRKELRGSRPP